MNLPPKWHARLNPIDMHDLYSCLMAYRNTYYPYDKEGFNRITALMEEVKGVYERDCPEEPPIVSRAITATVRAERRSIRKTSMQRSSACIKEA